MTGFRAAGLYPFNPDVLLDEAFTPSILTEVIPPPQVLSIEDSHTDYLDDETSNQF